MRTYLVKIGSTVGLYTVPMGPVRKAYEVHGATNDAILHGYKLRRQTFAHLLRDWRRHPRFTVTRLV